MTDGLLRVQSLVKHFDGVKALDRFSCVVREHATVGLIGPNGAGKTTLFNVLTGFLRADDGNATFRQHDLVGKQPHKIVAAGIARTFQNLRLIRRMTVLENVLLAYPDQPGESLLSIFFRPRLCAHREKTNGDRSAELLEHVGLREKLDEPAGSLSYGQQKLLSLACCLATGADLLLLDEPVAGIAPQMIEKVLGIIRGLPRRGKTVLLIEHNLDAVSQVCERVIFMDVGRMVCEGTPEQVRSDPRVIEAYLD